MEQSALLKTLDLTQADVVMIIVWGLLFVLFLRLVAKKLFEPFIGLSEARDAATTGAQEIANHEIVEAKEIEAKIEDRLAQVRLAGAKLRNEVTTAAKQMAQRTVEEAEAKAQQELQTAKEKLRGEIVKLKGQLEADCNQMVDAILKEIKEPAKIGSFN